MNNWKDILPINKIELYILRIAFCLALLGTGFGAGLFYTQHNFEKGCNYAVHELVPNMITVKPRR